jgi:tRNA A37 threonylcarbamoyladenosine dehydratase
MSYTGRLLPSRQLNENNFLMPIPQWLSRTELLTGKEKLLALREKHVLVAGLGGVGAMAAEQICRAGVGRMTIIDGDTVHPSNRNRQLAALKSTEGIAKTEVMAKRLLDINPDLQLTVIYEYMKDERTIEILEQGYDYVVDAIDTLSPKVFFLFHCVRLGLPVVSSMGAGGKYDPMQVAVADINDSYNCKLAYYMRKRLHKMGVWTGIKVIFSPEVVERSSVILQEGESNKKSNVGTISYMPAIFGCFCASVVLRDLMEIKTVNSAVTAK